MGSRPAFSVGEFVRARREFNNGQGPAEAWTRVHEVSLWRLHELAERAGSRTWAMLVAPPDLPPANRQGERLVHALRSAQVAAAVFPTFWRFRDLCMSMSYVVVAHQAEVQQAVRLAQRYGQLAVGHVQRIPFEHVTVHDVAADRSIEVSVFEPTLIAHHLAQCVGATDMAVVYRCTTTAECVAMAIAERRLTDL